ncbi:MAG: cytochrome c oxidase subunit 3 [Polynucleobacter sp.]|jgi:cytochrome c oxidase subunit III|uniref:cytochrome c oxidase subunit 3 n=1 Tax=Polynucleobacter sp. TaxID=2029855 RepID=UPI002722DEF0|nr:cytochrome c oxidase subunit 3 [Polynucleobacter sp.]MDO9015200.1 cytochrome c oxidase subunit 3 [Polynucleobacter sp.]MDP3121698.1 cytochrome c oxidase subunit 3 [Polynucleobacter sp.]
MSSNSTPYYFVPGLSRHPVMASIGLLGFGSGMTGWVNGYSWGAPLTIASVVYVLFVLYKWFGDAISESNSGQNSINVDVSYRWSMSWFIFSEIMFFAAFFSALFYARSISMPWLGDIESKLLWPTFTAVWPNDGPAGLVEQFSTIGPWPIPTINTLLLLTSGVTVTWAHHAIRENNQKHAVWGLAATVFLGAIFLGFQVYEYIHAYRDLNLKLTSGVYGSTFFMLTGFHGFHVFLGALMLAVVLRRAIRGDFTADNHFAFEGASWYWHFVDVVWLGLYVVIYWM